MNKKAKKFIKILIIAIVVIILIMQVVAGIVYHNYLGKHYYTYENSKGLAKFEDYNSLKREKADFYSNNNNLLSGYFYNNISNQKFKGVIIVNNGFGSGHVAMLSEIESLANAGYLIYGFDKTGYDESEGKGIKKISQGVYDLKYAIDFVKKTEKAKNLPILLYGKSWGACCCCSVLELTDDVVGVVSLSAFNKTSDMLDNESKRMLGGFSIIFKPFLKICNTFNENKDINLSSLNGLKKTNAKVLFMHSQDDKTVNIDNSFNLFKSEYSKNNNFTFTTLNNKNHSIITSDESKKYMVQMDTAFNDFYNKHNRKITDELFNDFLSSYDLKLCSVPDSKIMNQIIEFYDNLV